MAKRMTTRLIEAYADQSSTYARYALDGAAHIVCPQCRAPVPRGALLCGRCLSVNLDW